MTRFWLLVSVLFLVVVTPAEVHICKAGLAENMLNSKICIDETTAETETPVAAQATGIYSATMPLILLAVLGMLAVFRLNSDQWQPPLLALSVPTPPPRL